MSVRDGDVLYEEPDYEAALERYLQTVWALQGFGPLKYEKLGSDLQIVKAIVDAALGRRVRVDLDAAAAEAGTLNDARRIVAAALVEVNDE